MASYTSTQTGNWSSTATWGGSGPPGAGDIATIASGTTVTVDVNTTVGSKASGGGAAVTINGTSSSSFGTLAVANGVTLTLRGFDTTTNVLMLVNRYGTFSPAAGSTVLDDVAADFGSCILNNGILSAIGSSGSPITFSVPSGTPIWTVYAASEVTSPATYETGLNLASAVLVNPQVANSGHTEIGSSASSSLTIGSSTPSLSTEVSSMAAVNGAGKYWGDYDGGVVYFYTTSFVGLALTVSYYHLDKTATNWRGWGIISAGATTYNACLLNYCAFSYMGATGSGVIDSNGIRRSAPVNLIGHETNEAAGNSNQLA